MRTQDDLIRKVIKYASFEHMRELELGGEFGGKLAPKQIGNPLSYKTRRYAL